MPRDAVLTPATAVPFHAVSRLPAARPGQRLVAIGAALLVEALVAAVLLTAFKSGSNPREASALRVSLLAAPAVKPDHPPPPPVVLPRPAVVTAVTPLVFNLPAEAAPALIPRPVAAPAPYSPPSAPAVDTVATFEDRVRLAVQAAVDTHYPPAARMLHQKGQAQVSFDFENGLVNAIQLVRSSGYPLLDAAALATVRDAQYPAPPPALQNHLLSFVVWVKFRLAGED